jgi:hypothetical protein
MQIFTGPSAEAAEIISHPSRHSIHDRLRACVPDAGYQQRMAQALCTAAEQLEFLTPAVLVPSRAGLHTGVATHTQRGAVVFVLADGAKCSTTHMTMPSVAAGFDELIRCAEHFGMAEEPLHIGALTHQMVKQFGARPAQRSRRRAPDMTTVGAVLGALLRPLPADARADLARSVEHIRECDYCPALVGLVGPASNGVKGNLSFLWPLLIPVAEYSEAFMARAEADGG